MIGFRRFLALSILMALCIPQIVFAEDPEPASFISDFQWITYGSEMAQITTGLQFSHQSWYTELTMGGFSAFDNREDAFFVGLNLGHRYPIHSWIFLSANLGFQHVMPGGSDDPVIDTEKFFTLDGQFRIEAVLGQYMSVFIGAATTKTYSGDSSKPVDTQENSLFLGVGLL